MDLLNELIKLPVENELVEFKDANHNFKLKEIGQYFSGLANAANLKMEKYAWLIFGIEDKKHKIVGTDYRNDPSGLDRLKQEISQFTGGFTFTEIYELEVRERRVLMFQIPAAPKGIPIMCSGHYFGRNGSSLVALSIDKIERIRNQISNYDWSKEICHEATIADLEPAAIKLARQKFKESRRTVKDQEEVDTWDDITFLNKAKITIDGKIARAAIILLGKDEASHFVPSVVQISWRLNDDSGTMKDYEHFGPPFLLNSDELFSRVRNLKVRHLPNGTLLPIELTQYDNFVIREALHNCIAHQDYDMNGRINVVENSDYLIFRNLGDFLPDSVDTVIARDSPPDFYRNPFLANAMVSIGMIETMGSGIKKMFNKQKERYFPLPDYNFSESKVVEVKIFGKILDENYTNVLIDDTELDLTSVVLLDSVQKGKKITPDAAKKLRNLELIEGRYPNLYVSSKVAEVTDSKAEYIKNRGLDDEYYKELIISFIKEFGKASRKEITDLLFDKLSDVMHEKQKIRKIENLLQSLKSENIILNNGSRKLSSWILVR